MGNTGKQTEDGSILEVLIIIAGIAFIGYSCIESLSAIAVLILGK